MTIGSLSDYRVGVDIGGTFTDIILVNPEGRSHVCKVPSSPPNYTDAVRDGLVELIKNTGVDAAAIGHVVHGTTVATNAILERRGSTVALITTRGFRDVLEIGRMRLPQMYDVGYMRIDPLIPRHLRFEVAERVDHFGRVVLPLDKKSLDEAITAILAAEVDGVAVSLLHSYANPEVEREVAEAIRKRAPHLYVTISSDISPEAGEYERGSTVATNAYIMPIMDRYLSTLGDMTSSVGLPSSPYIMQSNGGVMSIGNARENPVLLIESGPAAGVVASSKLSRRLNDCDVISFDVGGTTAKAAVLERGRMTYVSDFQVGGKASSGSRLTGGGGGFAIRTPAVDLVEIGAGGGSIVAVDSAGSLKIGPRSAGSNPGPVCYDLGGDLVTLTDANICLGYLHRERLPSGLKLNAPKAEEHFRDQIANPLGLDLRDAAIGVYQVGCALMARAVRAVTIERGLDPRGFALVAFGGNGPLFSVALARTLGIARVIVPPSPGVFSAVGLLEADVERHLSTTFVSPLTDANSAELVVRIQELAERAKADLRKDQSVGEITVSGAASMRYAGQSFPLRVPLPRNIEPDDLLEALNASFRNLYAQLYNHEGDAQAAQIVGLSVTARRIASGRKAIRAETGGGPLTDLGTRMAYFGTKHGLVETRVLHRTELGSAPIAGPFLVDEYDSTTLVPPGAKAFLDDLQNVVIETGAE